MLQILLIGLAIINVGVAACAPIAAESWAIYLAILIGFLMTGLAFFLGNRLDRMGLFIPVGLFAIAASVGTVIGGKALRVHMAPKAAGIAAANAPRAPGSFEFDFADAVLRPELAHGELFGSAGDGWTLKCIYPIVDRAWRRSDPVPAWAMRAVSFPGSVDGRRLTLNDCPVAFSNENRPYGYRVELQTAENSDEYRPVVRKALSVHGLKGAAAAPLLTVHEGRYSVTTDLLIGGGLVVGGNLAWLGIMAAVALSAPAPRLRRKPTGQPRSKS